MIDKTLFVLTHDESPPRWPEFQAYLVSRSKNGKQVIAEKSGHFIQFDQPDIVIDDSSCNYCQSTIGMTVFLEEKSRPHDLFTN